MLTCACQCPSTSPWFQWKTSLSFTWTNFDILSVRRPFSQSWSEVLAFCALSIDSWLIFYTEIVHELVSSGRLAGSMVGGRQDKTLFVPDIYTKAQNEYVDNFLKQNGYLGKFYSETCHLRPLKVRWKIGRKRHVTQDIIVTTACQNWS